MAGQNSGIGYSLDEDDLVYFYSSEPVWYYNFTTGPWGEEESVGWIYVDWPYYYVLDTKTLMFVFPSADGLHVYHNIADHWEVSPQIIP